MHLNHTVHVFRKLCSGKNLLILLCVAAVLAAGFLYRKLRTPVGYDENMGGYILDAGDIVFHDEEEDFGYVSNMLLVYFRRDATDRQIDEVVQWLDGEVVGIPPRSAAIPDSDLQPERRRTGAASEGTDGHGCRKECGH